MEKLTVESFSKIITMKIKHKNPSYSEEQIATIQFGLEGIISEATKTLIFLVIFSLVSMTYYYIVAFIFFGVLRTFAGGYHSDSFWKCFFVSLGVLSTGIITGYFIELNLIVKLLIFIIALTTISIYAPVDHPNMPIISPLRRKKSKIRSIYVFIILYFLSFLLPTGLSTTGIITLLLEAFTLPLGVLKKGEHL